ncbi:hypothetical protein ISTM_444 [Insectomime virus]|uniref:Uncharacterized protein n=1 Tax=Tunisvirus fontaine2 TaxID=1421067 RepID=V9SEA5_9VIRU|nr:hypothetical protein D1R32_gp358 [Tunisvirus fontaine2]AHA46342.1 hypothetical protein ISTM_444 [Insectomime virus]AHC55075.1 hypothetical protein TNS_ORF357 [Tunisvirus fontaine2]
MEKYLKDSEFVSFFSAVGQPEKIKKNLVIEIGNYYSFAKLKGKYPHRVVSLLGTSHNLPQGVSFPKCKVLFAERCEKNFFFFFVNKRNFPALEEVWLFSHPCESNIFYMQIPKVVLIGHYKSYKKWKNCPETTVSEGTPEEFYEQKKKYF